jgi:hypothetical protein
MKKDVYERLVAEAGFCLWGDEPWKPKGQLVDWSQGYTKELKKFTKLVEDYVCKQYMKDVINLLMIQHEAARGTHNYWHVAANLVKAEFLSEEDV